MSTDRELLEAAAKAAGMVVEWTYYVGDGENGQMVTADGYVWNPITDDGDAFRLAVKLGMAVSVEFQVGSTAALWGPPTGTVRELHGDDTDAATRRAVVRAAAAIGGAKQ